MANLSNTYRAISLDWQPVNQQDERSFYIIAVLISVLITILAILVTSIDVPKKERVRGAKVPDRIAQYISARPKPVVPKPKVVIPPPPPKAKPKVVRKIERRSDKKITKTEQKARKKAEQTGLLALGNELADLMDTSDVDALLNTRVSDNKAGTKASSLGTKALTQGVGNGVAAIDSGAHLAAVGNTQLSSREITQVKQSLFKQGLLADNVGDASDEPRQRTGNVRSEEDITIAFDQNKGTLYSIYNRERRKNPSLRGKIVFELSIDPSGKVVSAAILSSALNDPALEKRLLSRIKRINFGAQSVELVTVTFPVEFLPS